MNIQEAAQQAAETNKCITIRSDGAVFLKVRLTNNPNYLCIGNHPDGSQSRRWSPSLNDLVSDEWEVVD